MMKNSLTYKGKFFISSLKNLVELNSYLKEQ